MLLIIISSCKYVSNMTCSLVSLDISHFYSFSMIEMAFSHLPFITESLDQSNGKEVRTTEGGVVTGISLHAVISIRVIPTCRKMPMLSDSFNFSGCSFLVPMSTRRSWVTSPLTQELLPSR